MPDIFGRIENPLDKVSAFSYGGILDQGPTKFLNNILRVVIVIAGLYAFINIIMAGFEFMNAGEEPKAIDQAWTKIWQSLVGLIIIAASFAIAAIVGYLLFGDAGAILNPKIYITE